MSIDRQRRIEEICHAALDCDRESRDAVVVKACGADEDLRREVESLLAHEAAAEQFLEMPACNVAWDTSSAGQRLRAGDRMGTYVVSSLLGAGGMGEVYRCRDPRLDRDVAVKILPRPFATDPDRLARFEREARVLAALNHPNIATIYGVERTAGTTALVLELVEGKTLAEILPLPVLQALRLADQIADGLEAAHDKGVVHRDLKPANIKVTSDGTVKLLDFGLAKMRGTAALEEVPPSITAAGPQRELVIGTAAYMSPESARGLEATTRSDVWAFGCVLYELLAGQPAFRGQTVTDTLAAVIGSEPEWNALPRDTPGNIRHLLRRCLAKPIERRLRSVGDARLEISDALDGIYDGSAAAGTSGASPRRWTLIAAVAAMGLAFGFGVARLNQDGDAISGRTTAGTTRLTIDVPETTPVSVGTEVPFIGYESRAVALSPDGQHLVYIGRSDQGTRLYHRRMDSFTAPSPLPGTDGVRFAFWSPDSDEIGFLTFDRLKKTTVTAGSPATLARTQTPIRATWIKDDIYFTEHEGRTLSRVSAHGGEPVRLFSFPSARTVFSQVIAGGHAALVTAKSGSISSEYASVQLLMMADRSTKPLIPFAYDARYVPSGHIIFARGGTLMAVPFDIDRLEISGSEIVVSRDVAVDSLFGAIHLDVSESGTMVYVAGGDLARGTIGWADRSGRFTRLEIPDRVYGSFDVSADGRSLLTVIADVNDFLWLWDDRARAGRIVAHRANHPRWDAGGQQFVYLSGIRGTPESRVVVQDGRSGVQRDLVTPGAFPTSWSRSGLISLDGTPEQGVGAISVAGASTPKWVKSSAWGSSLSPDGRYLAFATDDSGRFEVWVRAIDAEAGVQVSTDGGVETAWCGRCNELFYRNGNRILASQITFEPRFAAGPPRIVFVADGFVDTPGRSFDVSDDGERLYYVRRAAPPVRTRFHVVQNWFEELRRSVRAQ